MNNINYIKDIRSLVGNQNIILNFAGGVLVNNKNEILLQRRSDSKLWGLPGGAMELGETGQETCEREFLEETGLQVNAKSLLGITTNFQVTYPNGNQAQCVVIQYIVEKISGNLNKNNLETDDLNYFSEQNLPKIFNSQHEQAIAAYFSGNYPFFD